MAKTKPAERTEMVPVQPDSNGSMLAHYGALPSSELAKPMCSWSLETVEGRAKLHTAINGYSKTLWDCCESEPYDFVVTDLVIHYSESESEENPGEIIAGPRITLLGPSGQYALGVSASKWVFRALQQLAALDGLPPWKPGVILRAQRVPTRKRQMRLALTYVGLATE